LIAITIGLVPSHYEVGKEALYRLFEGNAVPAKLIALKVVFEVGGRKAMPVDHFPPHLHILADWRLPGVTVLKGEVARAIGPHSTRNPFGCQE
jgi:hypothetical protein